MKLLIQRSPVITFCFRNYWIYSAYVNVKPTVLSAMLLWQILYVKARNVLKSIKILCYYYCDHLVWMLFQVSLHLCGNSFVCFNLLTYLVLLLEKSRVMYECELIAFHTQSIVWFQANIHIQHSFLVTMFIFFIILMVLAIEDKNTSMFLEKPTSRSKSNKRLI